METRFQDPASWDLLWKNVNIATMVGENYGTVINGAIAIAQGKIAWLGPENKLPAYQKDSIEEFDGAGAWVTPGLIDCHTHLVFGGSRAREFAMRLQGVAYEEIARQGGGIISTVRATREADAESLFQSASKRLKALMAEGVTTVEIKSGYGLNRETEIKMLEVAGRLGEELPVEVRRTFLGAHAYHQNSRMPLMITSPSFARI